MWAGTTQLLANCSQDWKSDSTVGVFPPPSEHESWKIQEDNKEFGCNLWGLLPSLWV